MLITEHFGSERLANYLQVQLTADWLNWILIWLLKLTKQHKNTNQLAQRQSATDQRIAMLNNKGTVCSEEQSCLALVVKSTAREAATRVQPAMCFLPPESCLLSPMHPRMHSAVSSHVTKQARWRYPWKGLWVCSAILVDYWTTESETAIQQRMFTIFHPALTINCNVYISQKSLTWIPWVLLNCFGTLVLPHNL